MTLMKKKRVVWTPTPFRKKKGSLTSEMSSLDLPPSQINQVIPISTLGCRSVDSLLKGSTKLEKKSPMASSDAKQNWQFLKKCSSSFSSKLSVQRWSGFHTAPYLHAARCVHASLRGHSTLQHSDNISPRYQMMKERKKEVIPLGGISLHLWGTWQGATNF